MPRPSDKPIPASKANAAEAHLRKTFKGQQHAPKLAKLKAARTTREYVAALCELHGVPLAHVERAGLG